MFTCPNFDILYEIKSTKISTNQIFNTIFDLSVAVFKSRISLISSSHTIPIKISVLRSDNARFIRLVHSLSALLVDYVTKKEQKMLPQNISLFVIQFHLEKHPQLILVDQHQAHW